MLTEDEIFLAIDNVPITQKYVVGVARAIEAKVLAKLAAGAADAHIPQQKGESVQAYVQPTAREVEILREIRLHAKFDGFNEGWQRDARNLLLGLERFYAHVAAGVSPTAGEPKA